MKSLVIYFSHTGENYMEDGIRNILVGNTEIVAKKIANITKADLFKVETIQDYPYDYHECCEVAKKELEEQKRPELKTKLNDISSYDVIYVGGPVWYGHYPCALIEVLENLDFTGKIVKPFTTHEGSGLGSVMEDIKKYCQNANIKSGLEIRGCKTNEVTEKLERWCQND